MLRLLGVQPLLRRATESLIAAVPNLGAIVITALVLLDVAVGGVSGGGQGGMAAGGAAQGWSAPVETQVQEVRRTLPDGSLEVRRSVVQERRTGAPLEELSRSVAGLSTNKDKADISASLLDELAAADTPKRARAITRLVWQTWLFHESEAARQAVAEGVVLMNDGLLPGAEQRFQEAVSVDPHYAEGWNKLATVHYLMGRYEQSLADIDRTLALEDRHFGALSGRGLVLSELGRYAEAADAFREAAEVDPLSPGDERNAQYAEKLQRDLEARGR